MPRLFDLNNEPHDFCDNCFPSEGFAVEHYGDGGYNTEHPDYDTDFYFCEDCQTLLTEENDG